MTRSRATPFPPLLLLRLAALALLALAGCSRGLVDPVAGDFRVQRARWEAQRLDHYRFTLARNCFCHPEATQPARVEVRGDRVVRVTSLATGRELDVGLGLTVDELFERIAAAEADGTYLEVVYHPGRGYPMRAVIGTLANDAGVGYSLGELEQIR